MPESPSLRTEEPSWQANVNRSGFQNADMYWEIAADLYFPVDFDESAKYRQSSPPIRSALARSRPSGNVYGTALSRMRALLSLLLTLPSRARVAVRRVASKIEPAC